jgi:hypothetical protein
MHAVTGATTIVVATPFGTRALEDGITKDGVGIFKDGNTESGEDSIAIKGRVKPSKDGLIKDEMANDGDIDDEVAEIGLIYGYGAVWVEP